MQRSVDQAIKTERKKHELALAEEKVKNDDFEATLTAFEQVTDSERFAACLCFLRHPVNGPLTENKVFLPQTLPLE